MTFGYELMFVREKIFLKDLANLKKIKKQKLNFSKINKKNIDVNLLVKNF